jgi:hypothetical protein
VNFSIPRVIGDCLCLTYRGCVGNLHQNCIIISSPDGDRMNYFQIDFVRNKPCQGQAEHLNNNGNNNNITCK